VTRRPVRALLATATALGVLVAGGAIRLPSASAAWTDVVLAAAAVSAESRFAVVTTRIVAPGAVPHPTSITISGREGEANVLLVPSYLDATAGAVYRVADGPSGTSAALLYGGAVGGCVDDATMRAPIQLGPARVAYAYLVDRRCGTVDVLQTSGSGYAAVAGFGDILDNGQGVAAAVLDDDHDIVAISYNRVGGVTGPLFNGVRIYRVDVRSWTATLLESYGAFGTAAQTVGLVDGGPSTARFSWLANLAMSEDGTSVYAADQHNCAIRRIDLSAHLVSTAFRPSGSCAYAASAGFYDVVVGPDGGIWASDQSASAAIWRIIPEAPGVPASGAMWVSGLPAPPTAIAWASADRWYWSDWSAGALYRSELQQVPW